MFSERNVFVVVWNVDVDVDADAAFCLLCTSSYACIFH